VTRTTLADIEASLDTQTRDILAHNITYRLASGRLLTVKVQANYEDGNISTGISTGIAQEIEMMVLKSDLPARPASGDRIWTGRIAGAMFQPINVQNDESAAHWIFNLKKVAV
jgi:hypothetical protein